MVKWIKITTDIFDDEKIKIIDTMPARDEILVVWFKLLALAGKTNQSGMLFMNSKIAYTPEMLSAIFNRELNTIRLAISTFENFGMIVVEENQLITISNWEKHQNVDGLDKIREDGAKRSREYRSRQKQKKLQLEEPSRHVTSQSHDSNAIEEELEEEKKKKINSNAYTEEFEEIYSIYPNSKSKRDTFNNYKGRLKEYTHEELINSVKVYIENVKKNKTTMPFASNNFFGKKAYFEDFVNLEIKVPKEYKQPTIIVKERSYE